jgi:hypothetical protein
MCSECLRRISEKTPKLPLKEYLLLELAVLHGGGEGGDGLLRKLRRYRLGEPAVLHEWKGMRIDADGTELGDL